MLCSEDCDTDAWHSLYAVKQSSTLYRCLQPSKHFCSARSLADEHAVMQILTRVTAVRAAVAS
jgi:hypothetical protein